MYNKKKILIVQKNLQMGGVETSILNFVKNMSDTLEIEILLFNKTGDLIQLLPNNVKVIEAPPFFRSSGQVGGAQSSKGILNIIKSIAIKFKILKNIHAKRKLSKMSEYLSKIDFNLGHYDCVIGYDGFDICANELILNHIDADKKFIIIHNDVTKLTLNNVVENQFGKFDKCLGCSKSCTKKLLTKYPKLKNNVDTLYNFQDLDKFISNSREECENIKKDRLCIGTVARLHENQKAPIRTMKAIKKLNEQGLKFDFYWIGGGCDRKKVEKYIEKHNLNNVHLMGNQINPHKYIKQFDLFLLGSKFEAAPMVYAEAMTLGVPVLTTNTCSAEELVGDLGFVCDNTLEGIKDYLELLIKNPNLILEKKQKLKDYQWDNAGNKENFIKFIKND